MARAQSALAKNIKTPLRAKTVSYHYTGLALRAEWLGSAFDCSR